MSPSYSIDYITNSCLANFENFTQFFLGIFSSFMQRPYFKNFLFRKFGSGLLFTFINMTGLNSILGIVFVSTNRKVVWVTASPVITTMTHNKTSGNRSISEYICKFMGVVILVVITKITVASWVFAKLPEPTRIDFTNCDVFPKIFGGVYFRWNDRPRHKKSSLSSEARGKHTWYNPSAFDLPYRLIAMPRMLPTSRGFSVPIIPELRSK